MTLDKNATILVISHFTHRIVAAQDNGPPQNLRNFLMKKIKKIAYIELPFPYANDKRCYLNIYEDGKIIETRTTFPLFGPDWLQYTLQPIIIILLSLRLSQYTVCFALDNLSVISVLPLRFLKIIKKLIYYSIDYTPYRFQSKILNFIYQMADKFACAATDTNWVLSKPMLDIKKIRRFFIGKPAIFHEVPMGFPKKEISLSPISKIDRFHLVFLGLLLEKQGVQLVLESLPKLIQHFPKMHLTIIGTGNYEDELKRVAQKNRLDNSVVTFKGFMRNHREIESILSHAGVGLAPYKPDLGSFTYFADPGKLKVYLGCGLPIVTTSVPPISKLIQNKHAGIIMKYSKESFVKSVRQILEDSDTYANFRKAAIFLSKSYNTEKILKTAVSKIP